MMKKKHYPSNRLLLCILAFVAVGVILGFARHLTGETYQELLDILWIVLAGFGLLCLIDRVASHKPLALKIEREVPPSFALGQWSNISLRVTNKSDETIQLEIFDYYPDLFNAEKLPMKVSLASNQVAKTSYSVQPIKRGLGVFSGVEIRYPSRMGFWSCQFYDDLKTETRIFPNFKAFTNFALLAMDNHTSQLGIKKKQRRGEGMDFLQLREYRFGDSMRQIDWSATARRQKLISKEYQDERDQNVLVLLDSGQRMLAKDGDLSHYDNALNASLMLAYIALRQGDSAGMMSFGQVNRWIAPIKGAGLVNRLLHQVYDIHPGPEASDYLAAAEKFSALQTKRSLVVIVTNIRDGSVEDLLTAVKQLQKRHLVLVANIREPILDEISQQKIDTFEDSVLYAGTQHFIEQRKNMHKQLVQMGAFAIDCLPKELITRVINSYLEIKRSGYL